MTSDLVETLKEARALIAQGWTQGCAARDAEGNDVNSVDISAVSFCIYGACRRASVGRRKESYKLSTNALRDAGMINLSTWNDAPDRTQADVLALFDRAIAMESNHE